MQPILPSSGTPADAKPARTFLAGKLLLAMPAMGDPRFERAVIFVCAHDAAGAMGIVINNEMSHVPLSLLLAQLSLPTGEAFEDFPVLQGGPVETARGLLLHSSDVMKSESIRIDRDFAVTGTIEALREIVSGAGPSDKLFALGYAGWSAGQLEQEIAANAWLVVDADPELVFRTPAARKWEKALRKLGIDPGLLSGAAGHA
ncbi:MAG: YqgE/AlgH family protein [Rhodospirillales bacterium]|nr:YqgE/AlgH family protein [Alphaproteobacteria bacterium]MCB9986513.1 YqgE/AlgH family protein [Rhodospirillales bacterium]USO06947.1 MAG: YqgE/AlgH family protein [Rhodospirillales bacterium]